MIAMTIQQPNLIVLLLFVYTHHTKSFSYSIYRIMKQLKRLNIRLTWWSLFTWLSGNKSLLVFGGIVIWLSVYSIIEFNDMSIKFIYCINENNLCCPSYMLNQYNSVWTRDKYSPCRNPHGVHSYFNDEPHKQVVFDSQKNVLNPPSRFPNS